MKGKGPTQKPEGIIITMPVKFFQDYPGGRDRFMQVIAAVGEGLCVWNQTIASRPVHEVLHCYLCFEGRVQLRLNILDFEHGTKTFRDHTPGSSAKAVERVFENKRWVRLCGPLVHAPHEIPMKGFRGFRYTTTLF